MLIQMDKRTETNVGHNCFRHLVLICSLHAMFAECVTQIFSKAITFQCVKISQTLMSFISETKTFVQLKLFKINLN